MHTPGDADERLAWMDRVGIDIANTICLEGADYASRLSDRDSRARHDQRLQPLARRPSRWLSRSTSAAHLDRCHRCDWSIAELTRMRGRGSRAFLIDTLPAPGYPPMHERFEPLWSAAEDLGMVAFAHAGHNPASIDPAWANYPDGMVLRQLGREPEQPIGDPHVERHGLRRRVRSAPEAHPRHRRARHPLVRRSGAAHGEPRPGHSRVGGLHGPLSVRADACGVRAPQRSHHSAASSAPVAGTTARGVPRVRRVLLRLRASTRATRNRPRTTRSSWPTSQPEVRSSFLGENLARCYERMGDPLAVTESLR